MARGFSQTAFITTMCLLRIDFRIRTSFKNTCGRDASLAAIRTSFLPNEIRVTGDRTRHALFQKKLASSSSKYN